MAVSGRGQHAAGRSRGGFPWIQRQRGAAGEREVAFAVVQAATCHMHSDEARRACGIHRYRRTVQVHGIRDPPGRHAVVVAQESVGPLQGVGIGCRPICSRHASNPRTHRSASRPRLAGLRPACSTASQEVSSNRRCCGSIAVASRSLIPKKSESKPPNVIEERAPLRHRPTGHSGLGVVVLVGVPAVGRNFGDQIIAPQQRLPQPLWGVDTPGKSTGHADDGNRSDSCVHRGRSLG